MITVINAETRLEAWLSASEQLASNGDLLNLSLDIDKPALESRRSLEATRLIDAFYRAENTGAHPVFSVHTVAETIFPGWEYARHGLGGVYSRYPEQYARVMLADPRSWGRYAYRLISRETPDGGQVNPLEMMISRMKRSLRDGQTHFRACYELGITDGLYEFPLYDGAKDGRRLRGGPCLMHLSFKLANGSVHLAAMYRNHDYRYKVPGNLLGLARLQACVATEVGLDVGELAVHSTLAYIGQGRGIGQFKGLLRSVRAALGEARAHSIA